MRQFAYHVVWEYAALDTLQTNQIPNIVITRVPPNSNQD